MFLTEIFRAATPNNPRFSLNDPEAWDAFLAGNPSATGVRVTRELALTYAPWWRGIDLLSNSFAKLPLEVYKKTPSGRKPDEKHPAYRLIRHDPNKFHTAFQFWKLLCSHALQTGNGYAHIDRDGAGRPLALVPLNPEQVTPAREGGKPIYLVQVEGKNGVPRKVAADEIFHLRGLSFDGLTGYSVYDKARESLGLGMAVRKYGAVFFRNDARPNVAIEMPQKLNEKQIQEYRRVWNSLHSGLENEHRVALLHGGSKLQTYSIVARDAQMLETRQFEIREIALWIGIPAHKLGDSSKASYNSLEQENQDYLDDSLDPWLVRCEQECRAKLFSEEEKADGTHEAIYDRKKLVRANLADRSNYYQKATGNRPWMTPDEVREEEDLERLGGDSDMLKDPLNMGSQPPGKDSGEEPPAPKPARKPKPKPPANSGALALVIEDAARRAARRIANAAMAAAKKPATFGQFLDALEAEHGAILTEIFTPAAALTGLQATNLAKQITGNMQTMLLSASGRARNAEELQREVAAAVEIATATFPAAMAHEIIRGSAK